MSPIEVVVTSYPELFLNGIAPRLRASDLYELSRSSRALKAATDALLPLRAAWRHPLSAARRLQAEDEEDEAEGRQKEAKVEEGAEGVRRREREVAHERHVLRFMFERVLPLQGKCLGTQAAFTLLVPQVERGEFGTADVILSYMQRQPNLQSDRAAPVWRAFAWDVVNTVVRRPSPGAVEWLLGRLSALHMPESREEVVVHMARLWCFQGAAQPLAGVIDEPSVRTALLEDGPQAPMAFAIGGGHLEVVKLVVDHFKLNVDMLPADALEQAQAAGHLSIVHWLEARRHEQQQQNV